MKTTHTHRGTCQACGSVQAVDNVSQMLAKHGYKVVYGAFQFVCNAAGYAPAEHDVTYTKTTILGCLTSAEWHDGQVPKLKSGEVVPETFQRWNPTKVKVNRRRHGGTYETKGDYDTLPIAQANAKERAERIAGQIRHHELQAEGLRSHVTFLRRDVLPRLGQPLYANENLTKTELTKGMRFTHNGTEYELIERAYSTFATRVIGWYVLRVGADEHRKLRWTTKEIRDAMNPKPVKVEGAYKTKQARKDDLDKLNREYDKCRRVLQDAYLAGDRGDVGRTLYYAAGQLNHWRPAHSEQARKLYPHLEATIARIEALVVERERVKNAP